MTDDDLPMPGGRLTLTGTAQPGVESGSLLLQDYLLIGGPRELLGGGGPVRVTGRVNSDLLTIWQQGTPFVVETAEAVDPA